MHACQYAIWRTCVHLYHRTALVIMTKRYSTLYHHRCCYDQGDSPWIGDGCASDRCTTPCNLRRPTPQLSSKGDPGCGVIPMPHHASGVCWYRTPWRPARVPTEAYHQPLARHRRGFYICSNVLAFEDGIGAERDRTVIVMLTPVYRVTSDATSRQVLPVILDLWPLETRTWVCRTPSVRFALRQE